MYVLEEHERASQRGGKKKKGKVTNTDFDRLILADGTACSTQSRSKGAKASGRERRIEQSILTEKSEVRGRVTDELDERFPHGLADDAVRCDDVRDAEERKENADPHDLQRLEKHVFPPEARKTLVPNRCE